MSKLRISDAPLLPDVNGSEKIPTGGRGDLAISMEQVKTFAQGGLPQQINAHVNNTENPHQVSKSQVGLGNADNTSDVDKPISTATQEALDLKANQSTTYTKTEVNESLGFKADKTAVHSKSATLPTYYTKEAGINSVTGVANGAYFNARSSNEDTVLVEYQNIGGSAVATGKSYPSGGYVETIAEYTALPFKQGKSYTLYERVQLDNGEIVRSTIDKITNNPNTVTTGWVKEVYTTNLRQFFIKGDGSDETEKLQGAIDFCLANGVDVVDAENLRIKTTDTIVINKAIKIINNLQIDCYHDQIGLLCRPTAANFKTNDVSGEVLNLDVSVFRDQYYDAPTAVGIQLWNCYTGVIRYNNANRHYDALQLRADRNSGTSYCTFYLGNIKNCTGGVLLKEDYADGGWVTQNTFYDGNFGGGGVGVTPYMRYHIMFDGTAQSHNCYNVFFRPALEGWMTHGVIARGTNSNSILHPYIEMPNAIYYWDIESTSQALQITGGNGVAGALVSGKWRDFGSYTRIQSSGFSGQGALDYMNGTFYEYVDKFRTAREQLKPTESRGRVSVGFKTHKNIKHSVAGGLTIDLAEADAFVISVSADLTSITFTNINLVQPLEEKTISFLQTVEDLVITPFSLITLGSFSNPPSRLNAQHIYTLQRMQYSPTIGVVACATNINVNSNVTHSTAGALTLNATRGEMITVNADADITSMSLQQTGSLRVGGTRTIVFRQNSAGVTINAFTPAQLGQGKANPVSRPDGVDVYTLIRLTTGSIVCTSVYSS